MARNVPLHELRDQIDERVAARMRAGHWPGVALGIELEGAAHVRAYGLANLEHRVPVRADTVFRIGSLTKQFTAALVLKLQEQGQLSIDDDITRYLPSYPTGGRRITLHHLLAHTSGIQNVTILPSFQQRIREDLAPEAVLELFEDRPLRFEPGEDFEYCNSNFLLLGMILENVLGKPYSECIVEQVFTPLGLAHSYYMHDAPIVPNRASGYVWEGGELRNAPYVSMRVPSSAGALGSTVGDLLSWRRALDDGALLSPASLEALRTPKTLSSGRSTHYGYGIAQANLAGTPKLTHSGGISGFVGVLSFYLAHDLTIAILVNRFAANPWALDSELARLILGLPALEIEPVELSSGELGRYAGTYRLRGDPLPVTAESGRLSVLGQPYVPVGGHAFVASDDPESRLEFSLGPGGVESARMVREGLETLWERGE